MNNIAFTIESFKMDRRDFEKEYALWLKECEEKGNNAVMLIENAKLYKPLRQAILCAAELFDDIPITEKDRRFISGVKYVNNVLKHFDKQIFSMNEIFSEGFKISTKIDDTDPKGLHITDVKITPKFLFGEMENIKCDEEYKRQRMNYMNNLKLKEVTVILKELESLIDKYYPEGSF